MEKKYSVTKFKITEQDRLIAWLEAHRIIDPVTDCWLWTGPCAGQKEYGSIHLIEPYQRVYVHRLAAHLFLGFDLHSSLYILHRCDTPRCFNPAHLFEGTALDNLQDCIAKGRFNRKNRANGERVNTAKITTLDVYNIRNAAREGENYCSIGRRYGISNVQARNIALKISWKHLE